MQVRTFIGSSAKYALIDSNGLSMSVLLEDGKRSEDSLKNTASEMRQKAQALLRRAEIIESASLVI
jgi:hypothetical protein